MGEEEAEEEEEEEMADDEVQRRTGRPGGCYAESLNGGAVPSGSVQEARESADRTAGGNVSGARCAGTRGNGKRVLRAR